MKTILDTDQNPGTPIFLPDMKQIWRLCLPLGIIFWLIGLGLWWQQSLDETVLFFFNPARIAKEPFVILLKWITDYGMAAITAVLLLYLLASKINKRLDAPLTIYLYTICSFGISGIAGDLLKELFARPRPIAIYGSEILVLTQSVTPAIPSGHATKSIGLMLPFILLVPSSSNVHKAVKVIIAVIAGGVCLSRIVLGAHYVSDVVAGMGMALVGLPFTMLFANMILKQSKAEQLPFMSMIWGALLVFLTILFIGM